MGIIPVKSLAEAGLFLCLDFLQIGNGESWLFKY